MSGEKPLTSRMRRDGQPVGLDEYVRAGGYQGLRAALKLSPRQVTEQVTQAELKGRGGAGFPTGKKWGFVPADGARGPRYFVVNADEMEPGTMKDRILMEGDPHQLIEGIVIGSYAVGASIAYIFLRLAYHASERALRQAIAEAYAAGYLGRNILGSSFGLELHLHISAGRYMCGEETGLLNALEGRRATPRFKPPHPPVVGLWGKPTIVNNVETVCCVPHIVRDGWEHFRSLSRSDSDGGTKIYGASGRVKKPGLWELPMGTPLREILFDHAGGMLEGCRFRGLLPGGASTAFLVEEHLDARMDFASLQPCGSRMGTGTIIVLDDKVCPVGAVGNLLAFFARESCGWCTPCREGLPWIAGMLRALEEGRGTQQDLDILAEQADLLAPATTFCALAPGAADPLRSALVHFADDFRRHVTEGRCPWR
ncbi:MAG: NADH-ubiquinone oxidoreductase-F iron-sulfur binding region domain-containing protein [Phycisphaerae bacterium]